MGNDRVSYYNIQQAIRRAEREYTGHTIAELEVLLEEVGWSLEYIYLDHKTNRYSVQHNEESNEVKEKENE